MNARNDVAGIIKPRIAAVIFVRRIDQQIIQPRQVQRGRQPAPAFHGIPQTVEDHKNAPRILFGGRDEFGVEH